MSSSHAVFRDEELSECFENLAPSFFINSESDSDAYITQFLAFSILTQESISLSFASSELPVCSIQSGDSKFPSFHHGRTKIKPREKQIMLSKRQRGREKEPFRQAVRR